MSDLGNKEIFAKNLNYYLQKKGVDKRTFADEDIYR